MGCPCSHSCGPEILSRFDPATQRKMKFHPGSWLKWNPDDADVAGRSITNRTAFTAVTFGRSRKTSAHRRNAARPSSATLLRGVGTTNRYYGRHAEALSSNDLEDILEKRSCRPASTILKVPGRPGLMEPDTSRRFVIERLAGEIEIDLTRRQFGSDQYLWRVRFTGQPDGDRRRGQAGARFQNGKITHFTLGPNRRRRRYRPSHRPVTAAAPGRCRKTVAGSGAQPTSRQLPAIIWSRSLLIS